MSRVFCVTSGDVDCSSVAGEPRFPSHLFLEQRSPPPPPPPPTLLSSSHPVPTPSPLPFTQPGPAFNQQGQQPVFPRERPGRPTLQPPGPVGILHFSQPGAAATRPFIPPRQPFLPGPGQPFLPTHAQPNLQVRVAVPAARDRAVRTAKRHARAALRRCGDYLEKADVKCGLLKKTFFDCIVYLLSRRRNGKSGCHVLGNEKFSVQIFKRIHG